MREVLGGTKVLGVLGWPVAHSFSPPMQNAALAALGVSVAGIELWQPLLTAIRMLGEISIPLLLFSLGVRLTDANFHTWRIGVAGAAARRRASASRASPHSPSRKKRANTMTSSANTIIWMLPTSRSISEASSIRFSSRNW